MFNRIALVILAASGAVAGTLSAEARPQYARREGVNCGYCHLNSNGGGERGFRGSFYGANGLSFDRFDEIREAQLAGVTKNAMANTSLPTMSYCGSIAGPGAPQVQLMALSVPVIVVWLDSATPDAKSFSGKLAVLRKSLGRTAGVLGVAKTDMAGALDLTAALGNPFRVLPDASGTSIRKFAPTQALDFALIAKGGRPVKLWQGYSAGNLEELNRALTTLGLRSQIDPSGAPATAARGTKLTVR